jgi:hypothetical protein
MVCYCRKLLLSSYEFHDSGDSYGIDNGADAWATAQQDNQETDYPPTGQNIVGQPGLASLTNGWNLCTETWCVVEKWTDTQYVGDSYGSNGFTSSSSDMTFHHIDYVEDEPYYNQYKNTNGGQYP